jgi:hypothetical protein
MSNPQYDGMSDRERFAFVQKQREEEKRKQQQQHPLGVPISPPRNQLSSPLKDDPNSIEKRRKLADPQATQPQQQPAPVKYYACEKCKSCDEYVKGIGSNCGSCGCALLFHLQDEDEDHDDDEDLEWDDDDEDDY